MIVDTSALIAIINGEPGHDLLSEAMLHADRLKIGAPTQVEAGIVALGRWGHRGTTVLGRLIQELGIETVSFTERHAHIAAEAFNRFGKGRHKAGLNPGDCHTYATAYLEREPLLFVGDDFVHTDLELVRITP